MGEVKFINGTTLIIEDEPLKKLLSYKQKFYMKEAGGILLGRKKLNENVFTLCDITEPNSSDKRGYCHFVRDMKMAQKAINEKWLKSDGIVNYIGEWHTHPFPDPTPSNTDRKLIREIIRDQSYVFDNIFLIILANDLSIYIGQADVKIGDIINEHKILYKE